MSRTDTDRILDLARQVVERTGADQAEVLAISHESALTRFARNRIHQNVEEADTRISVRAVVGTRTGSASTNRLDESGLAACCEAAVASARSAPEDPGFPGLPGPTDDASPDTDRIDPSARSFSPESRAEAVRSIVTQSSSRGLEAAGTVSSAIQTVAIANSLGTARAMATSSARATVLSAGESGNSGWASYFGAGPADLEPAALGDTAASLAQRSAGSVGLDPGAYPVVLAPEAVADLLDFMGYLGFSARAVDEGRSFMSGRIGERIVSEKVTISDDALAPESFGLTFDFEGVSKRRVPLIAQGAATGPVTDSYWAARTERANSGHALPAPNSYGPLPLDLQMSPGDATIDELISSVERGVYVTRFHYVNIEDPVPVTLTGMTRDGTFLIEDGRLSKPLRNLRFTQGVISALGSVLGITRERAHFDAMLGTVLAPGVLLESWEFTGQTE